MKLTSIVLAAFAAEVRPQRDADRSLTAKQPIHSHRAAQFSKIAGDNASSSASSW
jgi:hypothetical protein